MELAILLPPLSEAFYLRLFTTLIASSLLILGGCSSVERFTPSSLDEKAITGTKTVRVLSGNRSEAVLSALYLNEVYPDSTDNMAHFIVAFYAKEGDSALSFTKEKADGGYHLLLNGEEALYSEELEHDDLLLEMMPINKSWSRYYYVRYKLPSVKPVLVLESDHTEKAVITYQKARR